MSFRLSLMVHFLNFFFPEDVFILSFSLKDGFMKHCYFFSQHPENIIPLSSGFYESNEKLTVSLMVHSLEIICLFSLADRMRHEMALCGFSAT